MHPLRPHLFSFCFLSFALLTLSSCEPDPEPIEDCKDCNAINYDEAAEVDDGSCTYENEALLGTFQFTDSIYGPPTQTWEHRSYTITVLRPACEPYGLVVENLANLQLTAADYSITGQGQGGTFTIPQQLLGSNFLQYADGALSNDTLFLDLVYTNEFGEPFEVVGFGVK